jgi:NAD(P)-dependent dehydrogenase (short-subunit alcohol dehydrogenase family)
MLTLREVLELPKSFLKYANHEAVLIHLATAVTHIPPIPTFSGYSASKLAQQRLFEHVQVENPQYQIIGVHPGVVESEMNKKAAAMAAQDTATLPADFIVWAASKEAEFLKGRAVWASWDIDELKAKKDEILADPTMLTHVLKVYKLDQLPCKKKYRYDLLTFYFSDVLEVTSKY